MGRNPNTVEFDVALTGEEPQSLNLDNYVGRLFRGLPILGTEGVINQIDSGQEVQATNGIITYSFLTQDHLTGLYNNPNYSFGDAAVGLSPFTDAQIVAAREAISLWDELIPLSFQETSSMGSDIQFSNSLDPAQAYAYYPAQQGWRFQSDVFIADPASNTTNNWFSFGGYGTTTLVHEIGHSLGLSHPGAYNYAPDIELTYGLAEYAQDSEQYTIMSYWSGSETGNSAINWSAFLFNHAQTPMLHDILTIQSIYGRDLTTRTGDTTYGFGSNAGHAVYDFAQNPFPYLSVYDAGGNDTINLSGFTASQFIDLHAGSFSSIGAAVPDAATINAERDELSAVLGEDLGHVTNRDVASVSRSRMNLAEDSIERDTGVSGIYATEYDNFSIAYGVTIENATGGSGNDLLWGNEVANILRGNGGNDVLNGFEGADTLYGGAGRDSFVFTIAETGDRIADYQRGDRIDLTAFGDLTYIGSGSFSGSAGQLRYASGNLQIDLDGNRVADFNVALSGSPAIASGDLLYA